MFFFATKGPEDSSKVKATSSSSSCSTGDKQMATEDALYDSFSGKGKYKFEFCVPLSHTHTLAVLFVGPLS